MIQKSIFLLQITSIFNPAMIRMYLVISIFLIFNPNTFAQRKKVKTYYENGQLESTGTLYSYSKFDKRVPSQYYYFENLKRKDKEWKYWYPDGTIKRIENYKAVRNISSPGDLLKEINDVPDGKWIYYNEHGIPYREDFYKDGFIYNSTKEIYKDTLFYGRITIQNGIIDTNLLSPLTSGENLIINSGFDFFFYKPVPVISSGGTKIEDWIPYWRAPGKFTPDYISNLRLIETLNYNFLFDLKLPEKFNYVGLGLYKESDTYSEYIQGQLKEPLSKGQKYCLRTSLTISSYSKYSVNRIGFNFSTARIPITEKNEITLPTPVLFKDLPTDNKQFTTLCDFFVAEGGEKFITIGRFSKPDEIKVVRRENIPQTKFGLEKSAYYLIDKIELFEIQDTAECYCKVDKIIGDANKIKPANDYRIIEKDLNKLKQGQSVILDNVNFEFNSFKLLPTAESVLKTLLDYLNDNPEVRLRIAGHTDDIGTEDYNLTLSINRAKAVYKWLIDNGIKSDRLEYIGFGKSLPLFKETDEKYRALNRRVEVKIIDK